MLLLARESGDQERRPKPVSAQAEKREKPGADPNRPFFFCPTYLQWFPLVVSTIEVRASLVCPHLGRRADTNLTSIVLFLGDSRDGLLNYQEFAYALKDEEKK